MPLLPPLMQIVISIHAPREGSDSAWRATYRCEKNFYPRSPRGERPWVWYDRFSDSDFYPRSPRGERLQS